MASDAVTTLRKLLVEHAHAMYHDVSDQAPPFCAVIDDEDGERLARAVLADPRFAQVAVVKGPVTA